MTADFDEEYSRPFSGTVPVATAPGEQERARSEAPVHAPRAKRREHVERQTPKRRKSRTIEKQNVRIKGFVNLKPIDHPARETTVNLSGDNRRAMTRGKDILKKLRVACAEVLDEAGVAATKKKHLLHSVMTAAEEKLSSHQLPGEPATTRPQQDAALLSEPVFPKGPPSGQLWTKHRRKGETPPAYILRVYGSDGADWLDKGLTLKQLRERDGILVAVLYRWRKTHKLPKELKNKLPTVKERNDRMLNSYVQAHRPKSGSSLIKELGRLRSACQRRREFQHS